VRPRRYDDAHPGAADTLLVVEVADAGADDRDVKLLLYSLAGVPEVWFVDTDGGAVDVYTGPRPSGWANAVRHAAGETLRPVALSGTSFAVAELVADARAEFPG
jgi:Uma2 family endonuclease